MLTEETYRFPCGCEFPVTGPPPAPGEPPLLRLDLEHAREDCGATWSLVGKGLTKGIFQLEAQLGRRYAKAVRPECMEHMSALIAILRPGPLKSLEADGKSVTDHYAMRKNGEEEVPEFHPVVDKILARTFGSLIYQESSLAIVVETAGFSPVEADALRKSIGKKDVEEMAKVKKMYLERAKGLSVVSEEQAAKLFDWIEKSQRYQFNACISENTRIRRASKDKFGNGFYFLTVGEMYKIRNSISHAKSTGHGDLRKRWKYLGNYGKSVSMGEDGRCRPNTIRDIRPAGVQPVYRIVLENGSSAVVTGNHKFPTNKGELTVDEMLVIKAFSTERAPFSGIGLFVCDGYEKNTSPLSRFSGISAEDRKSIGKGKSVNGKIGESNWGFTNGSFTKFHEFKTNTPATCFRCGEDLAEKRIETHHKNADRTNSDPDNLENLCVSCHKIAQYKMGRVRRGEKGYPTIISEIVSIDLDGEIMTYDVTMDGPNHNFVIEGDIVTCNSHSYAYAVLGYQGSYLKAHLPKAFFASALKNSHYVAEPQQEKLELVNDARLFDIKVVPPRLPSLKTRFFVDGGSVVFGLADVKGIGESQVRKLKSALKSVGYSATWSWWDYLHRACDEVGYATSERLISAGAFDHLGLSRRLMLEELRVWAVALTPAVRDAVKSLGDPLVKMAAVKAAVEVEVDEFEPGEMKSYRALKKEWDLAVEAFAKGEAEDVPSQPTHPAPIGRKVVTRKKSVKDEGGVRYEPVLDEQGRQVVLDPPRPSASLQEALRGVLDRGQLVKASRIKVEGELALLKSPIVPTKDTPAWVSYIEQELLGVSLTCQKVDSCDASEVNTSCRDFFSGKTGFMVLGVEVRSVREHKVKSGKNSGSVMAFLGVTDGTYLLDDVVVFADVYKEAKSLLQVNNTVLVQAARSDKKGSNGMICQRVWQMHRS